MAMNTTPVFTAVPNIGFVTATTANTALDGTGTVYTVFTAASNGSYAQQLIVKSNSTTATSAAATLRIFINNGSSAGTASNNTLIREYTLTTVTASATAATINWEFPLNIILPAGYIINVAIATVASSSQFALTCVGANY